MDYNKSDLPYIFIRAQDDAGKWGNATIEKVDDLQFKNWLRDRLIGAGYTPNYIGILDEYTLDADMRVEALNEAQKLGIKIMMIKH